MPPRATALALPDELLEEIFLRLPPDDPACIVRVSLACKPWLGLLTCPRFRGRYRDFHGSPPMLGFLHSSNWSTGSDDDEATLPPFVSTTSFDARIPDEMDALSDCSAWDCRHGRVLLCDDNRAPRMLLVVWDPMTGRWTGLDAPKDYHSQQGAVLCAVSGCDHRACHDGPFRVVFVGLDYTDDGCLAYAHVSLSENGEWSKPCSALDLVVEHVLDLDTPPVFIQDALYFMLADEHDDDDYIGNIANIAVLKYDLGSNCLSLIQAPPTNPTNSTILMALEDGGLGFVQFYGFTLNLWSRKMTGSDGVIAWTKRIVVNLKEFLPIRNFKHRIGLIGSMEGSGIIFVTTKFGIYEINLKSLQCKKLWKGEKYRYLIPYMSFYDPPGGIDDESW